MVRRLVYSLFFCGLIASMAGFLGLLYQPISLILVLPLYYVSVIIFRGYKKMWSISPLNRLVLLLLAFWWLLHAVKVFVPETGFDAVWYHLPVAKQAVQEHRFVIDPTFYQSFNPLFSDSIFFLGYQIAFDQGAKIIAFGFGLFLAITTYWLARKFINTTLALMVTTLVATFQVVSWQSSSFYIDVAKAGFEIAALALLLEGRYTGSALVLGASIASKLFSVVLLPLFVYLSKKWIYFLGLLCALPFYLMAYQATGNPIYSLTHNGENLLTWSFLLEQTLSLPLLLVKIGLTRDYTTPLLWLLIPLIITQRNRLTPIKPLLFFGFYQLLLWWYLPPLSTRYALSGFIVLVIAATYLLHKTLNRKWVNIILLVLILLPLPIRLLAVVKTLPYISGQQSKTEYLIQHLDENIDPHLIRWHNLDQPLPQ